MAPSPSQTKNPLTVPVAIIVFLLVPSLGVRVLNTETLVTTATYTAALVVFIGTSSGSKTGLSYYVAVFHDHLYDLALAQCSSLVVGNGHNVELVFNRESL